MTEAASWRPPGWVVPLFGLAALLLLPWVVLLVFALPSAHRSAHWDIAWAGFDVALALLLFAVAVAAWRRSPWLEGAATATATLLFVDAWFVELPLAVLCLLLARDVERRLYVLPVGPAVPARPRFELIEQPAEAERLSA